MCTCSALNKQTSSQRITIRWKVSKHGASGQSHAFSTTMLAYLSVPVLPHILSDLMLNDTWRLINWLPNNVISLGMLRTFSSVCIFCVICIVVLCSYVPCEGIILEPVKPGVNVGAAIIAGGDLIAEQYINIGNRPMARDPE